MKNLIIAALILSSCTTSKLDSKGNKVATWNTKHMQKIHKNGFYAGGKYIEIQKESKLSVKKQNNEISIH